MQQIYSRTFMPKCDFNKVAKYFYWNRTSAWVLSCQVVAYFQKAFSQEHLWVTASVNTIIIAKHAVDKEYDQIVAF